MISNYDHLKLMPQFKTKVGPTMPASNKKDEYNMQLDLDMMLKGVTEKVKLLKSKKKQDMESPVKISTSASPSPLVSKKPRFESSSASSYNKNTKHVPSHTSVMTKLTGSGSKSINPKLRGKKKKEAE